MKFRDIVTSVVLIGAAVWLAVSLFDTPTEQDAEFDITTWLFENESATSDPGG